MKRKPLQRLGGLALVAATALVLIGCQGSTGANGTPGTPGTPGSNAVSTLPAALNIKGMSLSDWAGLKLSGAVTNVALNGGNTQVSFVVKNNQGTPIAGLSGAGPDGFSAHLGFTIAKLIPATTSSPSIWENYEWVVPSATSSASVTSTIAGNIDPEFVAANLTDNGDGSYVYTYNANIQQAVANLATVNPTAAQTAALGDLSYQANNVYRIVILAGGAPTNSGTAASVPTAVTTAANIVQDFIPSVPFVAGTAYTLPAGTDEREIVNIASCNNCHGALAMHAAYNQPINDTLACVVCHTPQMAILAAGDSLPVATATATAPFNGVTSLTAFGAGSRASTMVVAGVAVPYFPNFIHKIHMGNQLTFSTQTAPFTSQYKLSTTPFNTLYPQDIRNCATCHNGTAASTVADAPPVAPVTADGANWNTMPSRAACGACHDNVDFAFGHGAATLTAGNTPSGPVGSDISACSSCHTQSDIQIYHTPVWTPTQSNSAYYQSVNTAIQPAGTHTISWNIIKVSVTAGVPSMTFNYLLDGQPATFNAQPTAGNTVPEMLPNFLTSLPKFVILAGLPQDGIMPADYNFTLATSIKSIWNQSVQFGATAANQLYSFTDNTAVAIGSAAAGVPKYTVTLTGYTLPANTGVVTMGIGEGELIQTDVPAADPSLVSFYKVMNMTYTATPLAGGLIIPSHNKLVPVAAASQAAGVTAPVFSRRQILKENACDTCHNNLGAFTSVASNNSFHGAGYSGDGNEGAFCIVCHNTTRDDGTGYPINAKTWVHGLHAATMRDNPYTPENFFQITYPGLLNNCEVCHVPGSYDFANTANAGQVTNMLWDTLYGAPAVAPMPTFFTGNVAKAGTPGTNYVVPQSRSAAAAAGVAYAAPAASSSPTATVAGISYVSPWVNPTCAYGTNAKWVAPVYNAGVLQPWYVNPSALAGVAATSAAATTAAGVAATAHASLVVSPIAAACGACHDTPTAVAHFKANGASWHVERPYVAGTAPVQFNSYLVTNGNVTGNTAATTATATKAATPAYPFYANPTGNLVSNEQCLICHGPGGVADIHSVHMNF